MGRISTWKTRRPQDHDGLRLANYMFRVRHLRGETQQNFAHRFEVTIGTYARWEKYGPPRNRMLRAGIRAKLHNMDNSQLYHGVKGKPKPTYPPQRHLKHADKQT